MNAKCTRTLISLVWIGSFLVALPMTSAEGQVPSVLSRLQVVEDPELAQLIRLAIENRRKMYAKDIVEELSLARQVTESYAQIKLLDRQIELLTQRTQAAPGPDDLRYELILAQAELEAKRTTQLANLRQIIGVMPDYALGPKPAWRLKTWLRLNVIGDQVYVTEGLPPFSDDADRVKYAPGRLMTQAEALESVRRTLAREDAIPIRIDIYRNTAGVTLSQELERDVIELIRRAKIEMQAEVHLEDSARQTPVAHSLYIERNRIATVLKQRSSAFPRVQLLGFIEPNEVDQYVRSLLLKPRNIPATFDIAHDPASSELAAQVTAMVKQTVQGLDLAECVEITRAIKELDPARRYLGRWEAGHEKETLAVTVQENSFCKVSEDQHTTQGKWSVDPEGRLSIMTGNETLHGHIDSKGNLVLQAEGDDAPVAFQRVE